MKKLPSIGFVYLLTVIIGFGAFLFWVAQDGWYDRINTSQQTEADLVHWADYLEEVANAYADSAKRVETMVESAQLRSRIGQDKKAIRVLEKALLFNPDNQELKALLLPLYWESGQKIKAIKLAKENLEIGQRNWGTISLLLNSIAEQTDTALVLKVVEAILDTNFAEKQILGDGHTVALGLTADQWTHDGKPGFLVISEPNVRLNLGCYAGPQYNPLTVTIEDQQGRKIFSHVFQYPENLELELPQIPIGENRLFIIKTDKFWVPSKKDTRRLGVRVTSMN